MMAKKKSVFPALLAAIAFAVVWFAPPVSASLYKWTDETGQVHFTDDKSKIPRKFRTKDRLKKLRQLDDRSSSPTASADPSNGGAGSAVGADPGGETDKGILSEKEEKAVEDTISFFDSENVRSEKYRGRPQISPNYESMRRDMKNHLSEKQKLIADLAGSKNPALKEAHGFLVKSEAGDQRRLTIVWQQGRPGGWYYRRILSEIENKNALKGKLLTAVEESKKMKEEKLKEEQEKVTQAEENKKTKQVKE